MNFLSTWHFDFKERSLKIRYTFHERVPVVSHRIVTFGNHFSFWFLKTQEVRQGVSSFSQIVFIVLARNKTSFVHLIFCSSHLLESKAGLRNEPFSAEAFFIMGDFSESDVRTVDILRAKFSFAEAHYFFSKNCKDDWSKLRKVLSVLTMWRDWSFDCSHSIFFLRGFSIASQILKPFGATPINTLRAKNRKLRIKTKKFEIIELEFAHELSRYTLLTHGRHNPIYIPTSRPVIQAVDVIYRFCFEHFEESFGIDWNKDGNEKI